MKDFADVTVSGSGCRLGTAAVLTRTQVSHIVLHVRFLVFAMVVFCLLQELGESCDIDGWRWHSGRKALIGKRSMTEVGRARKKGETDGFMKVLVDAETKKILGASLLGIECAMR